MTTVDSVNLRLRVDTVGGKIPSSLTLDLYDVNSSAADSAIDEIAALFVPGRLLASATFEKAALKDTINITLPAATILSRKGGALRIGVRARAAQSVQLRLMSQEGAGTPTLRIAYLRHDSRKVTLGPASRALNQPILAASLSDYTLLVKGTATGAASLLNVGGLPARRVYMRFDIPAFIVDSVDVVRATLLLTQQPNASIDPSDTVKIVPHVVLAANAVTDVAKAAQISTAITSDTLRITPAGTGVKFLEVANLIAVWRSQNVAETPRHWFSSARSREPRRSRRASFLPRPRLI